jgi:AcrR family transcriptional regulator
MLMANDSPQRPFDREAWLRAAMEVLAQEGQAKLRVDRLAKQLGVTKGSFYHHFASRDDFVRSLISLWSSDFTDRVIKQLGTEVPASERLLHLMQLIEAEGLDRYDIAFRSWAAQDEMVAEEVRKIDAARYRYVRSLFAELGFKGRELRERVRIWLVFHSAQRTVHLPENANGSRSQIAWRYAFFTRD